MTKLDVLVAVLVIVGALNWGLVAIANFDLVAAVFGLAACSSTGSDTTSADTTSAGATAAPSSSVPPATAQAAPFGPACAGLPSTGPGSPAELVDQQALANILKYHVVGQRPATLDSASLTTVQGGSITTAKPGDTYTANDATIICGNIQTANAAVYLVDTVLMPKT